jgi:hypothetical protein
MPPKAKSENSPKKKDLIGKFRVKRSINIFEAFEDKNAIYIHERIKYYNKYFDELKYQIIFQNELSFIKEIVNFVFDNGLQKYETIIDVLREFKRKINIITYQLDFVKNFYDMHLNKYTSIDINKIKNEYIGKFNDTVNKITNLQDSQKTKLHSDFKSFANDSLTSLYYEYKMPFKLLEKNKNKNLHDATLQNQLTHNRGYILHKNSIHTKGPKGTVKGNFPYKDIEKFSVLSLKYDTKKIFSFYIDVFSVSSILTYYVIQKYNHHFLLAYFFMYNTTSNSSSESYIEVISEQYNNNILQKLSQTIEEEKQKNIIIQCVLSIFSFHQYAKHYHNNTGDINQAFVYNETKPPEGKKRHVKYILGDKVFYLKDMGYIVYIWGFNQGKEQIEEIGTPDKKRILDDYLKFFNALTYDFIVKFKKNLNLIAKQKFKDDTFEIQLVEYILKLLGQTFGDENKPQDAEIINKDNPCYLTKPSDVEFCFAVNATSGDISSVDSTKITYNDNNTLNIDSGIYTTSDDQKKKIKKYTKDNTTIYLIKNKNVPSLHIAYIISDNDIFIKKQIEYENSEIKRIFDVYLSDLYDLTKFLTE